MAPDERAAMKAAFPVHYFMRVVHQLGEAIIAIPREQATDEKKAAVELWHGSTVKLGASSNGRTPDFDSGDAGSSPAASAR